MADFNLNDLYQRAFGHVRPPYPLLVNGLPGISPVGTLIGLKEQFDIKRDEEPIPVVPVEAVSQWGSPDVKFGVKLKLPNGFEFQIPLEPIISIEGGKNIIETKVNQGARRENVIEEINLNNWRVLMRGLIISDAADEYPEELIKTLTDICIYPGSIEIECGLLHHFGITQVVIQNFRFPGVPGSIEAVGYELDLVSDVNIDLENVPESNIENINAFEPTTLLA
jgi:hypothetical protein